MSDTEEQSGVPGRNGGTLYPFQPGQSGNPGGRKTAGATIREWFNSLAEQQLDEDALRAVARDKRAPWPKRAAAERILRTLEAGDLADFEPYLRGEMTLEQLREAGRNTELLKRAKTGAKGQREVELHDRAGADIDRIIGHTEPTPGEVEKNRRLDEGKATERVDQITMNVVGPRRPRQE
jgi:hypothetical protein